MRLQLAFVALLILVGAVGCRGSRDVPPSKGPGFSESGEIYQNRD